MGNAFCLDPSCFVTLQRLDDTLKVLEEMKKIGPFSTVYIPTDVYDVIVLDIEQKFLKLPSVLEGWLRSDIKKNVTNMNQHQKESYRSIMQRLLEKFQPKPAKFVAEDISKLGTESIHREDVINMFGRIKGKILFEIMAVSSRFNAKIIAFGRKTASLVSKLGITIIESPSRLKHELKRRQGIRTGLVIMLFAMGMQEIQSFINTYQLENFPLSLASAVSLAAFGVWMIGDGT